MTRVDLQGRLRNFLNNDVYYSGDDLNNSIQDGLDEVCAFSGCIFASATLPYTNNLTYYDLQTLLPNFVGLYAIYNSVVNRWMTPISLRKIDGFRIDWETSIGTPWYFVPINYRYIAIYKKPGTGTYGNMFVFYLASAPTLTDNTIIPIIDDHIQALETYNQTDLLEQQQEWTKANEMLQDYIGNLNQLRVLMRMKRNVDRLPSLK